LRAILRPEDGSNVVTIGATPVAAQTCRTTRTREA
jgi:hypothetical protein